MYAYNGLVGSIFQQLGEPTNQYIEGTILYKEWQLDVGIKNIDFSFVQKSILPHKELVYIWIDKFDFLPDHILLDAKRLYVETNTNVHPSRYAVAAIFNACKINDYFLDKKKLFDVLYNNNKKIKNKSMFISIIKNSNIIPQKRIKMIKSLGVSNA